MLHQGVAMSNQGSIDALKIGDFVTLRNLQFSSYLSAEGILVTDLYVNPDVLMFDDHVFCIHLQRQYAAAKELESFEENYIEPLGGNDPDPSTEKYLKALRRGRDQETLLNDTYMANKMGQAVVFGDIIQLYHVKSKKYVKIVPGKLAKDERENLSVQLDKEGSYSSWLKILPRFKIDREGDPIQSNNEVFLNVVEKKNEYLHCAQRQPQHGHHREVNCSVELSSWKLTITRSCTDHMDKSLLLSSQIVYIYDSESRFYLTSGKKREINLSDDSSLINSVTHVDQGNGVPYFHEGGDIILKQAESNVINSNGLWKIESKKLVIGGPIQYKTEQVRIRHLNTNMYLVQDSIDTFNFEKGFSESSAIFTLTNDPSNKGTLFSVAELNSSKNVLSNNKAVQISRSGTWFQRGSALEDLSFPVISTDNQEDTLNFVLDRYEPDVAGPDANPNEPLDVHVGIAARNYIYDFLKITEMPKSKQAISIWPSLGLTEIDFFHNILIGLKIFIEGYPVSELQSADPDSDKGDQKVKLKRQNLCREQGILDLLLSFVKKLQPITEMSAKLSNTHQVKGKVGAKSSAPAHESAMLIMGKDAISSCLAAIYSSITDNFENQLYVAVFLPVLLAHLSAQPLAQKCVTVMLSTNMELQETKISDREISIFVQKLKQYSFNPMYIALLQACCSCQGAGVDNNQCEVANGLYVEDGSNDDILMSLVLDKKDLTPCIIESMNTSIYMKDASLDKIFGGSFLKDGFPRISLKWVSSKDLQYSPQFLFRTELPPVDLVFKYIAPLKNKLDSSGSKRRMSSVGTVRSQGETQKVQIADYFVALMFLGAEMCMDRNYVSMLKLDKYYPIEVLVTMLTLEGVTSNLKSGVMRLLLCLHVDRDPQATTKIPVLSRLYTSLKNNPSLPYVEAERRYKYAIIQQVIADHIVAMAGSKWEEYSKHVLKMLRTLVSFNFYGDVERLKDVIGPLIAAVDRRNITYGVDVSIRDKPKSVSKSSISMSKVAIFNEDEMKEDVEEPPPPVPQVRWEKRLLRWLESLPVMCSVLTLVLAAVVVTIYQTITGADDSAGTGLYVWGIIVLFCFIVEFSLRCYCYCQFKGTFFKFMSQFFNIIDFIVISIDIVFLGLPAEGGAGLTKILRLVRMVRLLRVLRAARVINRLSELNKVKIPKWVIPTRYAICPSFEIETMVDAIDILFFVQGLIEDRNLSLLLRYFYLWSTGKDKRTPSELFQQVITESSELTLGVGDFNHITIDVLMFKSSNLTQSTLDVIIAHNSIRKRLLENSNLCQLVIGELREKQFCEIESNLKQLERNAETHELWGELQSDADVKQNQQTISIMNNLILLTRKQRVELEFSQDYEPDPDIQRSYRNLDCFSICLKILGLLDSVKEPDEVTGELDDASKNTIYLLNLCNELMYWFIYANYENQCLAYEQLDFFLDSLDANINSHLVIRAIFKDNEKLMRSLEHKYLHGLSDRIVKDGKKPQYLTLFTAITNVGDKNIVNNQREIMKTLTSPGRLEKVALYFVDSHHPDYEEKMSLMEPFLSRESDIKLSELPEQLAYHLTFIEIMANCTVGRLNITTVEAKVQSVFNYVHCINTVLDPRMLLIGKIAYLQFLFNAVIEVEMRIPGLEQKGCVWRLLESFIGVLRFAKDDIRLLDKLGWENPAISKHKIEYICISIFLISGFFDRYYDSSKFRLDDGTLSTDKCHLNQLQINDLITNLFNSIKDVYFIDSLRLSSYQKEKMFLALVALNKSASRVIMPNLERNGSSNTDDEEVKKALVDFEPSEDVIIANKFKEFMASLNSDVSLQEEIDQESAAFIEILESLPFVDQLVVQDLRFEAVLLKLVTHIQENMVYVNDEKRMNPKCIQTTSWIIRVFRLMIEKKMGMTIYDRDEDGGEEQDEAAAPVISALNKCGATTLCIDLIAIGIDESIQIEAIQLLVGLLFKEGGAIEVQSIVNNHLKSTNSTYFFRQLQALIQKLISWHNWHGIHYLKEGEEPDLPKDSLIIRAMQLLCEGHYLPNQDVFREQPFNSITINILDDLVLYMKCLSRLPCRSSTVAAIRTAATILEFIQGPSTGNQNYFALGTELLETTNRILRAKQQPGTDNVTNEELELKKIFIDILQGLLEGQMITSPVYERLLSVLHLDIIILLAIPEPPVVEEVVKEINPRQIGMPAETEEEAKPIEYSEEELILQAEAMVLLQSLCDFKPALREELKLSEGSGVASVEVVWHGQLLRRFFKIPKICDNLSKSGKDSLVEQVDRANTENKLIDFSARAQGLYRQVKHQQLLIELGISSVFSPAIMDRATWITFYLSLLINLLLLIYYDLDSTGTPSISPSSNNGVRALNIIHIIVSGFVLIQSLIIRTPVVYQTELDSGASSIMSLANTLTDRMTIYYAGYLAISILGLLSCHYFLPLLLLDVIVKNSTTQDVLNAVLFPIKALAMTLMLGIFVMYIYSYYIFLYFDEDTVGSPSDCHTLFSCFKLVFVYGIRSGGGIGDNLSHTIGIRLLVDLSFYFCVTIALLNIIFGIIIDTFGELRDNKNERLDDTYNICFICGIDKQTFDRASERGDGFEQHIKNDHHMWNYMYYIIFLWEQDKDDDDGLEQYIRRNIEVSDITWFPIGKAIKLDQSKSQSEVLREEMLVAIHHKSTTLAHRVHTIQNELSTMIQAYKVALKEVTTSHKPIKQALAASLYHLEQQNALLLGKNEEDEDKEMIKDDGSDADDADAENFGKHVYLQVVEILTEAAPTDDMIFSVRILCESGMYNVIHKSIDAVENKLYFDSDVCVVCENAIVNDYRNCRVQVIHGTANAGFNKFVASFEFTMDELIGEGNELNIVKTFDVNNQHFKLVLKSMNEVAKAYGINDDGFEEEEDL